MKAKKDRPFNLPLGTIRDAIALIFSVGLLVITLKYITSENVNQNLYTSFLGITNLVLGYYFGNRKN